MHYRIRLGSILVLVLLVTTSWLRAADRIVDVHVHFVGGQNPDYFQDLARAVKHLNYTACVLTQYEDRFTVAEAAKRYPYLVVPFGYVDLDDPHAVEEVKEFHRLGYRGLGELAMPEKRYNDPSYFPVYAVANQYHWVVLFHTGIIWRGKPAPPESAAAYGTHPKHALAMGGFTQSDNVAAYRMQAVYLEEIARRFPNITVIGAHCGNPDYAWAAELARWNPNLFFDLSGTTLEKFRGRLSYFSNFFWWSDTHEGVQQPDNSPSAFSKIVFGSDTIPHVLQQYRALFSACNISPDAQRLILGKTMEAILHLPDHP